MDQLELPGYDVDELIGFGGSGEVWRAREQATGLLVAIKVLRGDHHVGPADDRIRREAALLAGVRHDHIVRLRAVVATRFGTAIVLDYAEGGSLASLLAARHRLSPPEVVTLGVPLAQALEAVHGRGLVHGDVTPSNILFDAAGKPLLADLGVARLVGETAAAVGVTPGFADPRTVAGDPPDAASDVHGLAAVCYAALCGQPPYADGSSAVSAGVRPPDLGRLVPSAPPALVAVIESVLRAPPHARLDAAAFSRALFRACAPEPVRLVAGPRVTSAPPTHVSDGRRPAAAVVESAARTASGDPPRRGSSSARRSHRRSTVGRRAAGVSAAVALLAAAVVVGVVWASRDRPATAAAPVSTSAPEQTGVADPARPAPDPPASAVSSAASDGGWAARLAELDRLRDQAFTNDDPNLLEQVYLPTSPALAADRATLGRLLAAGEHAEGLQIHVLSVSVVSERPDLAELSVHDVLPAYRLVGADGTVQPVAGRGERDWLVTLRPVPGGTSSANGWLIDTIQPG